MAPAIHPFEPQLAWDIRHLWLHVLDSIRAIQRSKGGNQSAQVDDALQLWSTLGTELKLNAQDIRNEEGYKRGMTASDMLGCYWYKCPLYMSVPDTEREMMRCARCKSVGSLRVACSTLGPTMTPSLSGPILWYSVSKIVSRTFFGPAGVDLSHDSEQGLAPRRPSGEVQRRGRRPGAAELGCATTTMLSKNSIPFLDV